SQLRWVLRRLLHQTELRSVLIKKQVPLRPIARVAYRDARVNAPKEHGNGCRTRIPGSAEFACVPEGCLRVVNEAPVGEAGVPPWQLCGNGIRAGQVV